MDRALLILIAATLLGIMARLLRQGIGASRARRVARAGYFGQMATVFDGVVQRIEPTGFPRLAGRWHGLSYDLQVVPDTLTFRKLPALWVLVTQTESLPLQATLDVMIRPTLLESFSHFRDLGHEIARPAFLPVDCALRCDDLAQLPPESLLRGHAGIFTDTRVKELILSPKGLRLVFLAEEADRTRYLLFRDAEMGAEPLAAERLAPMLAALKGLREDVLKLKGAG